MTLRTSDNKGEKAVANFLDKYFYPNYTTNFKRVNDYETQMKGIDIYFDYKELTNIAVDEKAMVHYVNKNLPTFAFEINFRSSNGNIVPGWFYVENKTTQYYLLCWIKAKIVKEFTEDDISELEIVLIDRRRLFAMLEFFNMNKVNAYQLANELRETNSSGPRNQLHDIPFYFYYTTHLTEKPINLIIKKPKLIEMATLHLFIRPSTPSLQFGFF